MAGAGFVYYSSDYVFDGVDGPFGEDDAPRPISVYGKSKHEGEQAVDMTLKNKRFCDQELSGDTERLIQGRTPRLPRIARFIG